MLSNHLQNIFRRIDHAKKIIDQYRPLSPSITARIREQLVLDWTYNSNGIEGNTLSLRETTMVIQDGLTIGRKSMQEHLEAINHKEAIHFVYDLAQGKDDISERNIREIHSLVLKDIDPHYAGRYRDIQVRIGGSDHVPPPPLELDHLMEDFEVQFLTPQDTHPIEQAALAHFKLVDIHPFVDGNGRTARLLMNLLLVKAGYFPAIILKNDRLKYYRCIGLAHKGKPEDFIIFVARALERTLYLYLEAIPGAVSTFLSMAEAAEVSPYSKDYLGVMARRGVIPAFKLGRNWLIAPEPLQEYIEKQRNKKKENPT